MNRIYCGGGIALNQRIRIEGTDSHHVAKVLRLGLGEGVELFNGCGLVAEAVITEITKRDIEVEVKHLKKETQSNRVRIAFGIPKGQALDFILHRCTELGAHEFIPLTTEHSLHPTSWNGDRWTKVLIEVCKQCQAAFLPTLQEPQSLMDWLKSRSAPGSTPAPLLVCDEAKREGAAPFIQLNGLVDVLVGAEGGWSPCERSLILTSGGLTLSLGSQRLRAETAALVALALTKKLIGEIP